MKQIEFAVMKTVAEARANMKIELDEDGQSTCPCCDRVVRVYRRRLHSEMALWLIKLVREYRKKPGWYQTVDLLGTAGSHLRAGGTNGTLLVHWGLIERATSDNQAGAPVGSYRPTNLAMDFVDNCVMVPTYIYLLDNERVGASDQVINIKGVIGDRFSYEELMAEYVDTGRPQPDAPGY